MMSPSTFLPLLAASVIASGVALGHRRMPPAAAAVAIVASLAAVTTAAATTVWTVALAYLAHLPNIGSSFRWCAQMFGMHDRVEPVVGIPAIAVSTFGAVRALKLLVTWRRTRVVAPGPVLRADDSRLFACTLPGSGGRIIISSALDDMLDRKERSVVLAHERAHARHRHDRYLLIADLAVAVVPMLSPLARRLRYCLERWADEDAVDACGDRRFVALTLGKVAMGGRSSVFAASPNLLGFGVLGVPGRVAALLEPTPTPLVASGRVGVAVAVFGSVALSLFQLHHVGRLMSMLCPG
jgi:hypothetical protein